MTRLFRRSGDCETAGGIDEEWDDPYRRVPYGRRAVWASAVGVVALLGLAAVVVVRARRTEFGCESWAELASGGGVLMVLAEPVAAVRACGRAARSRSWTSLAVAAFHLSVVVVGAALVFLGSQAWGSGCSDSGRTQSIISKRGEPARVPHDSDSSQPACTDCGPTAQAKDLAAASLLRR